MSTSPAAAILVPGAGALARGEGLEATLLGILGPLADHLGIASAAVFVVSGDAAKLEIAAAFGLGDPTALATAVRNPAHPVARTAAERASAFDVRPMAAGGPALRSHLPLIIGDGANERLVGVLALAHDQPLGEEARWIVTGVADLAAVAIDRPEARLTAG
jgi:GAF domain-containing protein